MKKLKELDKKKGVAGLSILLSIVSMLFMIGIIVMVFILAGNNLSDSLAESTAGVLNNETVTLLNGTAVNLNISGLRSITLTSVLVYNETGAELVLSGNYSVSGGTLTATTGNTDHISPNPVIVYATYTYLVDGTASASIVDTTTALDDVTDWFSTFIVIASLVVLVLLVVIIINSIRGAGMTGEGSSGKMGA